jgi:hypothetical protein
MRYLLYVSPVAPAARVRRFQDLSVPGFARRPLECVAPAHAVVTVVSKTRVAPVAVCANSARVPL